MTNPALKWSPAPVLIFGLAVEGTVHKRLALGVGARAYWIG